MTNLAATARSTSPTALWLSQQEVVGDLAHGGAAWSGCPRTARSSCCYAEVSPMPSACCSLERRTANPVRSAQEIFVVDA